MTEEKGQNHYQVLGVERTADERAVKKAYFGLVRQFPPETHPEEFKRLREAYEVLGDPVARKRFDDAAGDYAEHDDETAVALREADAAVKADDEPTAQARLLALVARRPELRLARELLAASYRRTKSFADALALLDGLIAEAPDEARYHLLRGVVLHGLEKPGKAKAALRRALELAPDDVDVQLALVGTLADEKRYEEAIEVLDAGIPRQAPLGPAALRLTLRRLLLLSVSEAPRRVQDEARRLIAEVKEKDDPELTRFVSSQLAGVAASCFARKKPAEANALLERCEELHPESPVDHPFPAEVTLPVAALPAAAQSWLAELKPEPNRPTLNRPVWGDSAPLFLGGALALVLGVALMLHEPHAWDGASTAAAVVFVAAAVAASSEGARRLFRILKSPLRAFVTVHPLYLLEAKADRIVIRPLFGLLDVRAVHHHSNGVYQHTHVTLSFGARSFQISIRGREFAEGWVGYVLQCRQRALELMMEGYLEAEQLVDLIPPALLTRKVAVDDTAGRAAARRWYGATAAAALALSIGVAGLHARGADDQRFLEAVRLGKVESYQGYLQAMPSGRHAAEARQLVTLAYERAEGDLDAVLDARAPGAAALRAALASLRARGVTVIPIVTTPGAEPRAEDLAARLNRVLATAGVLPLMSFVATSADGAPATLFFDETEVDGRRAYSARLSVTPGHDPGWTFPREADAHGGPSIARFAAQLAAALGLGSVAEATRNTEALASDRVSPYAGHRP